MSLDEAAERVLASGDVLAEEPFVHFELGTAIRNSFGLWGANKELLRSCGSETMSADDALAIILKRASEIQRNRKKIRDGVNIDSQRLRKGRDKETSRVTDGEVSAQTIEQQAVEAPWRAYPTYIDSLIREMKDAVECEAFLKEMQRCPEQYRKVLRNGWVCVTIWAINQALSQSFNDHLEVAAASLKMLIERVVTEKEWFDPYLCEAIQPHMDELMPDAWTSKDGRPIFPVA